MEPIITPTSVERVGKTGLQIRWEDGHESIYTWTLLRDACPCAVCREGPPPRSEPGIQALEIQPVGRYALTVRFSDGHLTGIFSYELLRSICPCEECRPEQFTEG